MVTKELFGRLADGREVFKYTLRAGEYEAAVSEYGCALLSFARVAQNGERFDILLGYDALESYELPCGNMGASVGRYANRIANGRFSLDGRDYQLAVNNGPNHLHGGLVGFDKRLWRGAVSGGEAAFDILSPDGEEGYPGTLLATAAFALSERGELSIEYAATTDRATVLNLTNHSYFNLSGDPGRDVLDHIVTIYADIYLVSDENCLPTGELRAVGGTVFDLRGGASLGERLSLGDRELELARGYDHCFFVNGYLKERLRAAAEVYCPKSGARLRCATTQPGVQLYTANWLDGTPALRGGVEARNHHALCLETQRFPDSPNRPAFPPAVLRRGEVLREKTVYALDFPDKNKF